MNKQNEIEREEIKDAIKEIHFLVQVLQDTPVTSSVSREIKTRVVRSMLKEEQDYVDYFNSTFTDEEQKKIDEMIDNQIEDMKIKRDEQLNLEEKQSGIL